MISDSKLLASAAWDAQSLNELKAKANEDPAANIRPVARQVEGMFVQMMLKSMRDALPKDGLFSSEHTRLYTSMYDQQIAQQMTAGKGLGLAEMMVKQMTPEQPLPVGRAARVARGMLYCHPAANHRSYVARPFAPAAKAPDFDNAPRFRAGISSVLLAWTPLAMVVLASSA